MSKYVPRGYAWPSSIEGHGGKIGVGAYPNQGLDITTRPYTYRWLEWAKLDAGVKAGGTEPGWECDAAGDFKADGAVTPLGTPVGKLIRENADMLTSRCGHCQLPLSVCYCAMIGASDVV